MLDLGRCIFHILHFVLEEAIHGDRICILSSPSILSTSFISSVIGADSSIINNPHYVKDTAMLNQKYWDNDVNERRKALMPFVWKTLALKGSL